MNASGADATSFAKGVRVQYAKPTDDEVGIVGEVVSEGVRPDSSCIIRWQDPKKPGVSWTLLEDARRLIPARIGQ